MATARALTQEVKDDPETIYQEKLAEYNKKTEGLTPLHKHIYYLLDQSGHFSAASIKARLAAMHSSAPGPKGTAIYAFNAAHIGKCPFFTRVKVENNSKLSMALHLGTTRVWDKNGNIDEDRWKKIAALVETDMSPQVVLSEKLVAYLAECAKNDPEEKDTGRNTSHFGSSKSAQVFAAKAAWDECFNRLTSGWKDTGESKRKPYLTLSVIREFFENSPAAFLRAECGLLPVKESAISPQNMVLR